MKTLKNIAAIACVAALAVPAGVVAKGPGGDNGKSGEQHGQKQKKTTHVSKRCKRQPKVGYVVGGKLDQDATADTVKFTVTRSNKHARPFFPKGSHYTVADGDESKIQYKGDNPFTTPGAELHRSDWKVQVIGKVIKHKKGCTEDNSPAPTIKKIMVIAPGAGETGSNSTGSNT